MRICGDGCLSLKARKDDSILLVIDMQEKLVGTMLEKQRLIENVKALGKVAAVFHLPTLVTEQEKLGATVPELMETISECHTVRKLEFSCCQNSEFMNKLREAGRKTVVVCGIEAHICVLQTVLDLVSTGYNVHVVKDALSANAGVDLEVAVERMRDAGAVITTSEAAIYEFTVRAGTDEFRRILEIVKERRLAIAR